MNDIDEILHRFTGSPTLRALCLTGEWGTGKTHAVKNYCTRKNALPKDWKFSYASLFGITSLAHLRSQVCASAAGGDNASWADILRNLVNVGLPKDLKGFDLTGLSDVMKEVIQRKLLRNLVVCLDDLERIGDGLEVRDVLGLVSELIEERECKVILVTHDKRLLKDQRELVRSYNEKIFDLTVAFAPGIPAAAMIGFIDANLRNSAEPVFKAAGCANIRVMKRVAWIWGELVATKEKLLPRIMPVLVPQIARLVICKYEHADKIPRLGALLEWNEIAALYSESGYDSVSEDGRKFLKQIKFNGHPCDEVVITLLETGRLDSSRLAEACKDAAALAHRESVEQRCQAIQDSIDASLNPDAAPIVAQLRELLPLLPETVKIPVVTEYCDLLLELSSNQEDRELVTQTLAPLFAPYHPNIRANFLVHRPSLAKAKSLKEIAYTPPKVALTLRELFEASLATAPRDISTLHALSRVSSKEFESMLLAYDGGEVLEKIRKLVDASHFIIGPEKPALDRLLRGALRRISAASSVNRLRLHSVLAQLPAPPPSKKVAEPSPNSANSAAPQASSNG